MITQPINAPAGRRTELVGTFIKASGAARTMCFTTSQDKLRGGGLITVFDVERGGLRKFNLSTLVGRLSAVAPDGQLCRIDGRADSKLGLHWLGVKLQNRNIERMIEAKVHEKFLGFLEMPRAIRAGSGGRLMGFRRVRVFPKPLDSVFLNPANGRHCLFFVQSAKSGKRLNRYWLPSFESKHLAMDEIQFTVSRAYGESHP